MGDARQGHRRVTPEAASGLCRKLAALAETVRDEETRERYRAAWRARYDALFPPADPDDPILPPGNDPGEATAKEKALLAFVAERWWIDALPDLPALDGGRLKAVAAAAGRRVAAGMIARERVDADLPEAVLTQPAWSEAFRTGLGQPFKGKGQLLALRCARLPLTGFGLAERFRLRYGHDFLYTTAKGWFGWDGRRWRMLDQEQNSLPAEVKAAVFATIRDVQDEARLVRQTGVPPQSVSAKTLEAYQAEGKPVNPDGLNWGGTAAAALADWARACETNGTLAATASVAMQWLTRPLEAFDVEPMAVCAMNGVLRFERDDADGAGSQNAWRVVLHPHRREDMNTRLAPVAWDPEAKAERFQQVIRWAQPERARRRYVRQWLGYNMTGHTGAQILQFWFGKGANGKSTVIDACASAIGDYAGTILIEALLDQSVRKSGDAATPALARLSGVRLLRTSEPEENSKLNEALIKLVTGQEPFPARALHKGFFDLRPDFKLTISGNHELRIKGTDEGIWRRLKQVPWESRIADADKDEELPDKLRAELPGIFAWMVRGLLDWLEHGFVEPESVTAATAAWRDESDPVGRFLRDCTEPDSSSRVQSSALHALFVAWAKAAGEFELSNKRLTTILKSHGYKVIASNGNHIAGVKTTRSIDEFVDSDGKPRQLEAAAEEPALARPPPAAPPGPPAMGWSVDDEA
jgi:DNA primase